MNETQLWADLGGAPAIHALVAAFYRRVPQDDILGPMYPEQDFAGAEQRLADFLCFRLGGDPTYLRLRGHPRLKMRHMPFAIDDAAAQRWVDLMREAMKEVQLPAAPAAELDEFFVQVAQFLRNQPES